MKNHHLSLTRIFIAIGISLLLLLIPLIASLLSADVNWSPMDYLVGGILLTGLFLAVGVLYRLGKSITWKVILIAITLIFFLLIWLELAVGIFNSPFAGS